MRVLVVEDEPSLREGISDLLRGDGHTVMAAADGVAGLATGLAETLDLVILDLMLPRLGGTEVCPTVARPAAGVADPDAHRDGLRGRQGEGALGGRG